MVTLSTEIPMEDICELMWQAADAIMEVYQRKFEVQYKKDDSPVTEADLKSHQILEEGLKRLTPELPLLSEESNRQAPWEERQTWTQYWLLDPLDGTKGFLSHTDDFTINLALIKDHEPIVGLVSVPAQNILYVGRPEHGYSYILDSDKNRSDIRCRYMSLADDTECTVVTSRHHRDARLEMFLTNLDQRMPRGIKASATGSALKLCILAQGEADLYPRLGPTSEWDIAAPQAVLQAAGGQVLTLDGKPLLYNTKDSLLNPEFMAVADPGFHWHNLITASLPK